MNGKWIWPEAMAAILGMAKRDLRRAIATPFAGLLVGLCAIGLIGLAFWPGLLFERARADMRPYFDLLPWVLALLCPALAMGAWANERRDQTLESLRALPQPFWVIVSGKFVAILVLAILPILLSLPLTIIIGVAGPMDIGATIMAYFAACLCAGALSAFSLFICALVEQAALSFALAASAALLIVGMGLPFVGELAGKFGFDLANFSLFSHFDNLVSGLFDVPAILFFLSLTFISLSSASLLMDQRDRLAR